MTDWQPIETWRGDEFVQVVLVSRDSGNRSVMPAVWDGDEWRALTVAGPMTFIDPTHWMPLPKAPEQSA